MHCDSTALFKSRNYSTKPLLEFIFYAVVLCDEVRFKLFGKYAVVEDKINLCLIEDQEFPITVYEFFYVAIIFNGANVHQLMIIEVKMES